jgi:LacI family transcriptional regulator
VGPLSRRDLYRNFLRENGLYWSEQSEVSVEETHQGGIEGAEQLFSQFPEMDAVLVYSDVMAIGALKGFEKAGVDVPRQVAVIGVDGLDIGSLVTPELTTLSIDKSQIARHAMDLVADILAGTSVSGARERDVGLTLVIRQSA